MTHSETSVYRLSPSGSREKHNVVNNEGTRIIRTYRDREEACEDPRCWKKCPNCKGTGRFS